MIASRPAPDLPAPSPYIQFLVEMDRLEQLQSELSAHAEHLEGQLHGPWLELRNSWGRIGIFRLEDVKRMRQGICKLLGIAYKQEWKAEERKWEWALESTIKQQLELRDAVLLVYHNRIRRRPGRDYVDEAREVAGWDNSGSTETGNRRTPDDTGGKHPP